MLSLENAVFQSRILCTPELSVSAYEKNVKIYYLMYIVWTIHLYILSKIQLIYYHAYSKILLKCMSKCNKNIALILDFIILNF